MSTNKIPKGKKLFLYSILVTYLLFGIVVYFLVSTGKISHLPILDESNYGIDVVTEGFNLSAGEEFVNKYMLRNEGHIDLYVRDAKDNVVSYERHTNSEAVSYYLLWNARAGNKEAFDRELDFIDEHMIHPQGKYLMWRLEDDDSVVSDGGNIASDADLRAIRALMIAQNQWGDGKYSRYINSLSKALEDFALTEDNYLAPYGGTWGVANESWLSYGDFVVFEELGKHNILWSKVGENMKQAVLQAQISNGLYNQELDPNRNYGNKLDNGNYSINSLWIMVRSAESSDPDLRKSAMRALNFYKDKYSGDGRLVDSYGSDSEAKSDHSSPWVYALVGRAAFLLNDDEFGKEMLIELGQYQVSDKDIAAYGAIIEGEDRKIGQFTMQESILAAQESIKLNEEDSS